MDPTWPVVSADSVNIVTADVNPLLALATTDAQLWTSANSPRLSRPSSGKTCGMADEQDRAEELDEEAIGAPAPDHLMGAEAFGAAGVEPHAGESVARRAARENPEPELGDLGPLQQGAEVDPTLHDFATELEAPVPAELAAMHEIDEGGPLDDDRLAPADLPEDDLP